MTGAIGLSRRAKASAGLLLLGLGSITLHAVD